MSRVCQICGKRPHVGRMIARRGLAKAKGGVGLKTTGMTKRRFLPNLQNIKAFVNGNNVRMRVCTRCIKSERVRKGVARRVKPAAA